MAIININPLIDAVGGSSATGATGSLSAVAHAGGLPASRIAGAGVIIPEPVTISFTNGVLDEVLDLDVLPTGYYWKFTICVGDICRTDYFTIPAEATYDYNELTFVDPATYTAFTAGPKEAEYVVSGGTDGTQPTFTGAPLFEGRVVRIGDLAYFDVQVVMTNITGFGTGQYFVTLPFPSKYSATFRGGSLKDASTGYQYHITGAVEANSNELTLWTTDVQGNNVRDYEFTSTEPVTLAQADTFHISGQYILVEGD